MTRHTTDGQPGSRSDAATAARPASEPEGGRIGVSGVQVAAGVLASVSAAMVSSYFGVAGTIVGAAVFSIFATVGSAAYGLGIRRTTARLQQVQTLRMPRPTVRLPGRGTSAEGTGASTDETADDDGGGDAAEPEAEAVDEGAVFPGPATEGWRHWLARRRWSLAAGVAVVFVLSLATVTLIEAVADRPLAGEDSGSRVTSIGSLFSGGRDDDEPDDPGTPTTTTPDDPSSEPSSGEEGDQLPSTTAPESDEPGAPAPPPPTTSTTAPTTTTTSPTTTATSEPAAPPPVTESEPAPEVAAGELTAPAG
ncbi:MAG: hypothetical protein JXA83_06735 [Acidimicrobiales bacterium]|nr:hypothetical protein [Acidimicrobiales bacterium]